MKDIGKQLLWVSIYAIAMALLESVAVIYIRRLLQITETHVSLGPLFHIEIWREAATITMLVAVGWLAGRRGIERLAYGLFAFGLWDIIYYVWLKVLINWPATLLDWDVLFLIPLRWWGPVLSPVLIATLICVTAILALMRLERKEPLGITSTRLASVVLGGLLALYAFTSDSLHAWVQGRNDWAMLRPGPFKWPIFLIALALMAWPSMAAAWPWPRRKAEPSSALGNILHPEK
jgi:hypothetical protein